MTRMMLATETIKDENQKNLQAVHCACQMYMVGHINQYFMVQKQMFTFSCAIIHKSLKIEVSIKHFINPAYC